MRHAPEKDQLSLGQIKTSFAGWYWFRGQAGHEIVDLQVMRLELDENEQFLPTSSLGFHEQTALDKFDGHRERPLTPYVPALSDTASGKTCASIRRREMKTGDT